MKKRLMSVVLALAMVISLVPTTAFAANEPEKETINYVSLGDSTTNGYGLSGYEFDKEDSDFKEWVAKITNGYPMYSGESTYENPNGLLMETPGAYPALFRDYLADKTGKDVNLIQLATSAMRADDVLTLLTWGTEDQYLLDEYSGNKDNSKYVIHNYSDVGAELPFEWKYRINEGDNEYGFNSAEMDSMGELYQKSVEAADVISINLGSNNFSIYLWGCLGPAIMGMLGMGDGSASYDPMLKELLSTVDDGLATEGMIIYEDVKATLMEKLADYIPKGSENSLEELCSNLADYATYTFVSYCVTYTRILERINELNSDADIILLPMVNFMKGFSVDIGEGELVDMSDLIGYMLDAANYYVAGMASVKDGMDYISNDVFYADHGGDVGMLMAELPVLAEKDFEGASVLRDRMISDMAEWMGLFSGNSIDLSGVNLNTIAAFPNNYSWETGLYLGLEKAIVAISQEPAVDIELFMSLMAKDPETGKSVFMTNMAEVFGTVNTKITALMQSGRTGDIPEEVETILMANPTSKGMLYVMAYFMIADGVVCHPSESGYETMYEAMVDAYETKHTAADQTKENLIEAAGILADLVAEYYDEAYAYAYAKADEAGYIDATVAGIDNVIEALKNIDLSETEMTDEFKAELMGEIEEIIETLVEAKELIEKADKLDEETLKELMDTLNEGGEAIENLLNLLKQAGDDVTELVIVPALEKAYDELVNVIIPEALENLGAAVEEAIEWLKEQAEAAYEAFVDAAYEAVKEYAPKVADAIYDYLYNNPEEVIAFVREYGDDFVNFIAQYDEEILAVLGYIAYTYGDDIVNFVIENHEEILDTMIAWYEVHGENTWALIDVYLEALGVYDAAEDLKEDLEDKLNDAAGDIMDAVEDAIAELEAEIEKLEGIVEDLKAELEDLKAELENAAEDAKAEIEAAIEEIEKAIEEIEAVIETLKEKLEELYQIAEDICNATQDVIDALLQANEDVEAALKALQEALEDLADAVEAAEKFLSELNDAVASVVGTIADIIERIAEISTECGEAVAEIVETVIYILENAEEIVAGIQDAIEEAAELVAELVENFKEALFNATHALVYGCAVDSYVALGGAAVAEGTYVTALGEELGVEPTNLGDASVNFTTLVDYVTENAAAIYGADVITYQMEATAFITTFADALMDDLSLDMYWDEDVQVYVDKIEEALMAKLAEEYDEQTLEIAAPIAKKLVYAMVAYAVETVEALETINAINPEATVLVVGMYNPLADLTVVMDGEEIAIGEMAEYVIDATDLYYLVYAVASGNVKFVDACDTAVSGVVSEINVDEIEAAIAAIMEMIANAKGWEDMQKVQAAIEALTAELYGMYDGIVTAEGSQEDIYDNIMDVLTVEAHKWALKGVTAPTCTEDGYTTYECELCGETKAEDVMDAIGHAWGAWTDNGNGTHSRVCANGASHVETEAHYDDNKDGICDRLCGYKYTFNNDDKNPSSPSRDWHCPTCKSDTCHSKAFSDLDLDAWYHKYTDYVLCKGMMKGMGGDIFAPNAETTRAMLTTILYRMAGSPAVSGEMPFADVAADQWYSDAILWAAENDIVLGYGDGNFGPMDTITREQIAALFFRFAELKGMNVNKSVELSPAYDDASDVGAWAVDYVEWAVATGLMQGRSTHMLAPAAGTTRAEVATLLERWCEEIAD